MGLPKYLKGVVAVLTVAVVSFALSGCGGGKKEVKEFSVPVDKLPEGIISVIKPKPNNETLFVRALVQEVIRQNIVAQRYNEALIHYDSLKGNAAEHEKLLKKTKEAWKSARDAASVATFYAMALSQLERTEGYNPYQNPKTAMLTVPEIHLMPVAYAKEDKKYNSKEEVFSKYSPQLIRNDLKKIPEGKQLLAISKMYHTTGKAAVDIMNTVNPDYTPKGRSWGDITADVAYRSANVAKTAGKIAGVGLAAVGTMAAAGPVAALAGGIAVTVKIVDTGLDAVQTSLVVLTGEEDKGLNKALAVTGTADTVVSIMTFDLSKPMMGNHGIKFKDTGSLTKNIINQAKGYVQGSAYGASKAAQNVKGGIQSIKTGLLNYNSGFPVGNLKLAAKQVMASEGNLNALSVTSGIIGLNDNYNTLCSSSKETGDGRTETRTGSFSVKNGTEEDNLKAKALGLSSIEDLKKLEEAVKQQKADAAVATSKEFEKAAEEAANSGGAGQYTEMFNSFVDATREGLLEAILGPGGNMNDLDKILTEAAGEEMKATNIIVSRDEEGNITRAAIVGEKKNAEPPFAPAKVAGTYKVPVDNGTVTIIVKVQGEGITLAYPYYRNNVLKHRTETPASYDPKSGKGTLVNEGSTCSFWFTQTNGKMSMNVGSWSKIKK